MMNIPAKILSLRLLAFCLVLLLMISCSGLVFVWAEPENEGEDDAKFKEKPEISGASAVLIDADTGQILFKKKAKNKREPASTTKIMTAMLALENLNKKDKLTLRDDFEYRYQDSSIALVPGEKVSVNDLLYAALLASGNDAALALAEGVSGTEEEFVDLMNERVKEMGLKKTHFANPHGLHDEKHYSSAYDLAMIAREAMKNKDFRKYVKTYEHQMKETNKQAARLVHNSNRLLYSEGWHVMVYGERRVIKDDEVTGVKTGYTTDSRNTLVASAKRDGLSLIAVSLKSEGVMEYQDVLNMFEYGFHNYTHKPFIKAGEELPLDEPFEIEVKEGVGTTVGAVAAEDIITTVKKDKEAKGLFIRTSVAALTAPVEEGQVIGQAIVTVGEKEDAYVVGETDLLASSFIAKEKKGVFEGIKLPAFLPLALKIGGVLIGLAAAWVIIILVRAENKRRSRRMRRMYGYRGDGITKEVKRIKRIK